jgi:hypothetical protein
MRILEHFVVTIHYKQNVLETSSNICFLILSPLTLISWEVPFKLIDRQQNCKILTIYLTFVREAIIQKL